MTPPVLAKKTRLLNALFLGLGNHSFAFVPSFNRQLTLPVSKIVQRWEALESFSYAMAKMVELALYPAAYLKVVMRSFAAVNRFFTKEHPCYHLVEFLGRI